MLDAAITSLLGLAVHGAVRSRLDRLPAAVIVVAAALPTGFVPNALAQLQFPLVYAGLWMLLWRRANLLTAGPTALAGAVQLAAHGFGEDRYLVLIGRPDVAAGVCLAAGAQRSVRALGCVHRSTRLVVFATLVAVVLAANLRPASPRDGGPRWGAAVRSARAECLVRPGLARTGVHIAQWPVLGWEAVLPCARLR
ncbi:hypothetical protein [Dactylosporangium sp. NPDC049140]|uniref:hypothetical protein n=1 Tax=Dactylosporangium sp. NPDC049140 TaxID=3155647 RepID=UPI0033EE6633